MCDSTKHNGLVILVLRSFCHVSLKDHYCRSEAEWSGRGSELLKNKVVNIAAQAVAGTVGIQLMALRLPESSS